MHAAQRGCPTLPIAAPARHWLREQYARERDRTTSRPERWHRHQQIVEATAALWSENQAHGPVRATRPSAGLARHTGAGPPPRALPGQPWQTPRNRDASTPDTRIARG